MQTVKLTAIGIAVLAFNLVFTGCPNPSNDDPTGMKFIVSLVWSVNAKWGDGHTVTANVDTELEGAPSYAWTGIAGTNPGNSATYTMVEDDENKTITCTVTIGEKTKAANAVIQPMYANLNPLGGGIPFENRSTSKTDAQMTSEDYYSDMPSMTPQKIVNGQWNGTKTEDGVKEKIDTYPVKKFVIIESGSSSYANGIIYIPYNYLFDSDSAVTTMGYIDAQIKSAYSALAVLVKQQDVRLANASVAQHRQAKG
ncbi:hypothetical protein AGMMS50293_01290 [Spirochaetia bacterium]|nr:hypothetical protein AGMMS50293_01290 [Spirochaetia bacterium]